MSERYRLDVALRHWGLVPSRAKGQELIAAGAVEIWDGSTWTPASSDAQPVDLAASQEVRLSAPDPFVSRGGRKLLGALTDFAIEPKGWTVLDVGLSTGGFAQCLLQQGAKQVIGVDVGHGQLAKPLQTEARLTAFEGVNARHLTEFEPLREWLNRFDLVTVDVSFISLNLIMPAVAKFVAPGGGLLALIKPQFEVGPKNLNGRGIVTNLELHAQVRETMESQVTHLNFTVVGSRPSRVTGQDGNQEYFLYANKPES